MGIKGLWAILGDDIAEKRSLLNLSTIQGFETDKRRFRKLIVGIDISIFLAAIRRRKYSGGETGALRTFFFKLCHLQKAALIVVFVLDGLGRPSFKRGKKIMQESASFMEQLKRLIKSFGFYCYEAPGEAEAELGQLNKLGFIDAVITEDSDVLLFGAKCVIRTTGPNVAKLAHVFEAAAIASPPLYLDEDGLLLVVLMAGGDYHEGIPNCGAKIAHALAKYGAGRELRQILTSFAGDVLDQRLAAWRDSLRTELRTNSSGLLDKRHPKLAERIPDSFPDLHIVRLYMDPLTSWCTRFIGDIPDISLWIPREPVIHEIADFCVKHLGWTAPEELKKRFQSLMWPGVAFRLISSVQYDSAHKRFLTPTTNGKLVKVSKQPRPDDGTPTLDIMRVRISISNFNALAQFPATEEESVLVTVPKSIFAIATRDVSKQSTSLMNCNIPSDSESDSADSDSDGEDDELESEVEAGSESDSNSSKQVKEAVSGADESSQTADIIDVEEEELLAAHRALKQEGIIDLTGEEF